MSAPEDEDAAGSAASSDLPGRFTGLPRFPAMAGYQAFAADLRRLGLRHVADLLRPEQTPLGAAADSAGRPLFLVLDGVWFPSQGAFWQPVDQDFLAKARSRWSNGPAERSDLAASLLDRVERLLASDPSGLRRVLLYQLEWLLLEHPQGPGHTAADSLGVHPDEAGHLADAVRDRLRFSASARKAAEELVDLWNAGRLRQAVEYARRFPAEHGDPMLTEFCDAVRDRADRASGLLAEGARLLSGLAGAEASVAYLGALRLVRDDLGALDGLLRAAVLSAQAPGAGATPLRIGIEADGVMLAWPPASRPPAQAADRLRYRVLRMPLTDFDALETVADGLTEAEFFDGGVPAGVPVRYLVVPMIAGLVDGTALASGPVVFAYEVAGVQARAVPEGVQVSWRVPADAVEVRALRRELGAAGAGAAEPVRSCSREGFVDTSVTPGRYRYRVQCGFPRPDGVMAWSDGVEVDAQAELWPLPVSVLDVALVDETTATVQLRWTAPARGAARLVHWPFPQRPLGADASDLLGELSPAEQPQELALAVRSDAGGGGTALVPVAAGAARYVVVSELGPLAVVGPSVLLHAPGPIADLAVHRIRPDTAQVSFRWPDPAVITLVRWESDSFRDELRVSRSSAARSGVQIPVGPQKQVITVEPVGRPDADLVFAGAARAVLAALPPAPPPLREVERPFGQFHPGQPGLSPTQPRSPWLAPAPRLRWWQRLSQWARGALRRRR